MKSRLLASTLLIFLLQSGCLGASPGPVTEPQPGASATLSPVSAATAVPAQPEAVPSGTPRPAASATRASLPTTTALPSPTATSVPAEPTPMPSEPAANTAVPADFQIRYEWREGSLPPPYHYEYTIRIGPGTQGEIVFLPDYPSDETPVWTEPFTVSAETLAGLYMIVEEQRVLIRTWTEEGSPAVGGSVDWAEITANGTRVSIPDQLGSAQAAAIGELYTAVRAAVPEPVWAKLRRQQERYQQEQ